MSARQTKYDPRLAPNHAELIRASAITPEVAAARGYFTATKKVEVGDLGFAAAQRIVPGLVLPVWSVTGERVNYQLRPDQSRIKDGKPIKYETPKGSRMHLDLPPTVREQVADPKRPLFVTEGLRKADAAASAGLCCLGLTGVWNWRGRNQHDGLTALADWDLVALNGRDVYVVFDSDVVTKVEVEAALRRLKGFLELRRAKVRVVYLPATEGAKVGLDDFLAGHRAEELLALAEDEIRTHARSSPSDGRATVQPQIGTPQLSYSKNLLEAVAEAVATQVAGEVRLVKLVYLAATSRLESPPNLPVSIVVKGPSAAGKSNLVEKTLQLFPEEAYYQLTAVSEHALAYSEEPIAHRVLVFFEAGVLSSDFASYLVRSLLSEGRLRYETVEKTDEGMRARLIEREGPTGLITTTTAPSLHPENETRLLSLTADDSKEQTRTVLLAQAKRAAGSLPPARDLEPWRQLQRWLQSRAPQSVVVPFADRLAELIPPLAVRLRRDFPTLLGLVRAHALLHQQGRDRDRQDRIIASLEDYAAVLELVADLMADSVAATVSATVRATVEASQRLLEKKGEGATLTVLDLAHELDLDKSAASRRVSVCIQDGYLVNEEEKRGKPRRLVLGAPLLEAVTLLPSPEQVSGCTVADNLEGDKQTRASADAQPDPAANGHSPNGHDPDVCPCGVAWSKTRPGDPRRCVRGHLAVAV